MFALILPTHFYSYLTLNPDRVTEIPKLVWIKVPLLETSNLVTSSDIHRNSTYGPDYLNTVLPLIYSPSLIVTRRIQYIVWDLKEDHLKMRDISLCERRIRFVFLKLLETHLLMYWFSSLLTCKSGSHGDLRDCICFVTGNLAFSTTTTTKTFFSFF